jgi:hypothetical protein
LTQNLIDGSSFTNANMSETTSNSRSVSNLQARQMRNAFAVLIREHSALAARDRLGCAPQARRLQALLEEFSRTRELAEQQERSQSAEVHEGFTSLLSGYNQAVDRDRHQQEQTADDFNLLDVMQLTGRETRHSMVLAWLLDHDLRKLGTHAQGNLGFRLFLDAVNLPSHYAEHKYWVRREVVGDVSVVDVEVACRGEFLIHIENKIWSGEGPDQANREWSDLQRQAEKLGVKQDQVHALFVTPEGRSASNSRFQPIPWRSIARVMEQFADQAKPPDVKLFARHYASILRRYIGVQETGEDDYVQKSDE